jgi:hypothetical protein
MHDEKYKNPENKVVKKTPYRSPEKSPVNLNQNPTKSDLSQKKDACIFSCHKKKQK